MAQIQRSTMIWALTKAIQEQEKVEKKLNYFTDSAFTRSMRDCLEEVKAGVGEIILIGDAA